MQEQTVKIPKQFFCHPCGEEIVPDRSCLTGWKHKRSDDNVCKGGGSNAVPEYDPWARFKVFP